MLWARGRDRFRRGGGERQSSRPSCSSRSEGDFVSQEQRRPLRERRSRRRRPLLLLLLLFGRCGGGIMHSCSGKRGGRRRSGISAGNGVIGRASRFTSVFSSFPFCFFSSGIHLLLDTVVTARAGPGAEGGGNSPAEAGAGAGVAVVAAAAFR